MSDCKILRGPLELGLALTMPPAALMTATTPSTINPTIPSKKLKNSPATPSAAPRIVTPPTKAEKPRLAGRPPQWWPRMSETDIPSTTIPKRAWKPRTTKLRSGFAIAMVLIRMCREPCADGGERWVAATAVVVSVSVVRGKVFPARSDWSER